MFGLNGLTTWLIGGMAAALLLSGLTVWYYKAEYDGQLKENGRLETALTVEKAATENALKTVDAWKSSAEAFQRTLGDMTKNQLEATKETRRLNDTLSGHDIGALAKGRPGILQGRVNTGTERMRQLLERASGGPDTEGGAAARQEAVSP